MASTGSSATTPSSSPFLDDRLDELDRAGDPGRTALERFAVGRMVDDTRRSTGGCWPADARGWSPNRRPGPPSGRGPSRRRSRRAPSRARRASTSVTRARRARAVAGPSPAGPRARGAGRSGPVTESIPSSATPRRMNGNTVVSSAAPPALPDGRHRRPAPERPQHVRAASRADRIDGAGPALRFERPALRGHLVARQDARPPPAPRSRAASSGLPVTAQTS